MDRVGISRKPPSHCISARKAPLAVANFEYTVDSQTSLALPPPQDTCMGTRLYVSNLPLSATEEMLNTRFGKFGAVLSVALEAGRNRHGAFVEMKTSAEAFKAISALNLSEFDGRLVSVQLALASLPTTS